MTTIKLHDARDPMDVGREVFNAMMAGEEREILTDRAAVTHAFYCACENMGGEFEWLADRASLATNNDPVDGLQVIQARESMAHALDVCYTLMGLIWDTTPGIREAEERYDPATGSLRPEDMDPILAALCAREEEGDDDDDDKELVGA